MPGSSGPSDGPCRTAPSGPDDGTARSRMIRLDDLQAAVPELTVVGPAGTGRYARFCIDSRLVEAGDLFVAVRTQRGDGHDHVPEAVARGARAVLVDDPTA